MSSAIIFQRFLWFHNEVKQGKHPNARTLAQEFEITAKTAQRNIEFISMYLKAPLRLLHGNLSQSRLLQSEEGTPVSCSRTEQSRHPGRKVSVEKDGRLKLTIPVSDFQEMKREILQYGAQVEVLSPAA